MTETQILSLHPGSFIANTVTGHVFEVKDRNEDDRHLSYGLLCISKKSKHSVFAMWLNHDQWMVCGDGAGAVHTEGHTSFHCGHCGDEVEHECRMVEK